MRRVFFSFHYDDVFRVNQIRNIGQLENDLKIFVDKAEQEKVKKTSDTAVKKWIDEQLYNTSVTIVLIGNQTADRSFVQYEIKQSVMLGKAMLGIYIHNIKDKNGKTTEQGPNPFVKLLEKPQSNFYEVYNPNPENAYLDIRDNIDKWIEVAVKSKTKFR